MQKPFNPYVVLGVSRTCDAGAIRAAHKALIVRFHPDINREPGAADRAAEINAAFDVLSDPYKRAAYDALRRLPADLPPQIFRPAPIDAGRSPMFSRGALASAGAAAALLSVVGVVWYAEIRATSSAVDVLARDPRAVAAANIASVPVADVRVTTVPITNVPIASLPMADVRRVMRKALRTAVPAATTGVIAPGAAAVERIVEAAVSPIRIRHSDRQVLALARSEALTTVATPARAAAAGRCAHRHAPRTPCDSAQGGGWTRRDSQAMASLDPGPPEYVAGNIREIDPTPVALAVLDSRREPELPGVDDGRSKPQRRYFRYRYRHIGAAPGRPAYPRD